MLGPRVLLFPDSGPAFLRALRTAAFYSDEILRPIPPVPPSQDVLDGFRSEMRHTTKHWPHRRPAKAFQFQLDAYDDIALLAREGILKPPAHYAMSAFTGNGLLHDGGHMARLIRALRESPLAEVVARTYKSSHPVFSDFLPMYAIASPSHGRGFFGDDLHTYLTGHIIGDPDIFPQFSFTCYLASLGLMAEACDATVVTLAEHERAAIWAARALIRQTADPSAGAEVDAASDREALMAGRAAVLHCTAQTVIERYIPAFDNLTVEEVLELRHKRLSELLAFRVGLARVAAGVDVTKSAAEQQLHIRDLIATEVDPAVRDLEMAIRGTTYDAIRGMAGSVKALGASTVPLALTYVAGLPVDWRAALASIAVLVGSPLLDATVERRKLLDRSQWSLLADWGRKRRKSRK